MEVPVAGWCCIARSSMLLIAWPHGGCRFVFWRALAGSIGSPKGAKGTIGKFKVTIYIGLLPFDSGG